MGLSFSFQNIFLFMFFILANSVHAKTKNFRVLKYGAVRGGKFENSQAFYNAWNKTCEYEGGASVFSIPKGTFLVKPMVFVGPCKGPIQFIIRGNLVFPKYNPSQNYDHWLSFRYIDQLTIDGLEGSMDAQGPSAWPYKGCKDSQDCMALPISLRFDFVTNSWIKQVTLINSQDKHIKIFASENIRLRKINIVSPDESPNTDGIYIASSKNIEILDSTIGCGDDCISIGPSSNNISITNVKCGPGHGLSIGSLGNGNQEKGVNGVIVRNCTFLGTQNGLRIKTWAPSMPSIVSDLIYDNIYMRDVFNPIIIDQKYCPSGGCKAEGASRVQIKNAQFINIWGTSSSKVAVNLQCSEAEPCQKIELRNINLEYHGEEGGPATSLCSNVMGVAYGKQNPSSCINHF